MLRQSLVLLVVFLASACANLGMAQDVEPTSVSIDRAKALKYHSVLQRRPSPGYLFDRFYNTWLDTSSLDELESFLADEATKSPTTENKLLLAFFFVKQGEDVRALEQFRVVLETDPTNAATLYEKAVVEARNLDFETALSDLTNAAAANPKDDEAIKIAQFKGKLLVRNRQNDEAIKVWQELIKANPDNEGLMQDVIELQISEGLYDEADALSDKLISVTKDPYQKVMRRLRKGDIFQRAGKRKKALDVYGETLGQVGMDTWLEREILGQIEQLFRREDDLVGLSEHYKVLTKAEGKRMSLRKAAAKVLVELGSSEEAVKLFEEIIKLTPGDRSNREAFIELLTRADKLDLAVKQTESLVQQYPQDAELQIKLAELRFKSGATEEVDSAIQTFIAVSGEKEFAYLRAARLLEKFALVDKATAIYEKAVATFPDSDSASESYATFLYKNEKKDDAIAIWKQLADGGDRTQLVRIARIVGTRQEHETAFQILFDRYEDFKLDTVYLGQLCTEAIALKKFDQSVPWVTDRVRLAKSASDLDSCLGQAVQVISNSKQLEPTVATLNANTDRNVALSCLLAELLEQTNRSPEADAVLKTALDALTQLGESQKDPIQMLARQRVRVLTTRQDWEAAATAAKEMIGLPGGRKSVNIRQLVELYNRAGNLESALTWVGEWKKISPGSLLPWTTESQIYERMGQFKDSINVLRMATQKFPNDPDLFAQLGERYMGNGQYKDAERIYWRQYEESEQLSDKLRWSERLADLSDDIGEMDQLIEKFEERKRNNPQSIEPLLAMAQAHRIADNYEERRMALLEATRLQKDSLPLMMEIARLEETEGEWEKAIQTLEEASKIDKTTRSREQIARLYIQYGESSEGFSRMLEIAGGENSTARDVESVANAIIGTEDWDQAREFLLTQVGRFEDDYRLRFQLAIVNEELDLIVEAQDEYLRMLNVQHDIKGSGPSSQQNAGMYDDQIRMLRGTLPDAAVDVYELELIKRYEMYSGRSFGGGGSSAVMLPQTARSCRIQAIAGLLGLQGALNDDELTILKRRLKQEGVGNVELLFSDSGSLMDGENSAQFIDDHPDNETALAIGVFAMVGDPDPDPKYGVKGFETFKSSYPVLAFLGALQAAANDEEHHAILDEAIKLVEDTENPNAMLVSAIARFVAGPMFGEDNTNSLSKSQISQLNGLLVKWYPNLQSDPNMSPWIFMSVAGSLKSEATADLFIEFLDEEIVRSTANQAVAVNPYFGFGYGSDESLVAMPVFPPEQLISFPSSVYGVLNLATEEYSPFGGEPEDPEEWSSKFANSIDKVKSPILKTLIQMKISLLDADELVKPEDQRMLAAKKTLADQMESQRPDIDAYYLAACLATSEQRFVDASNLFERMRNLPMSREMRQTVDGHLVAIATQGILSELKSKANEPVLNSAKSAALRLRRIRLDPGQRADLLSVFETLELNEEAKKMESKIAQSNSIFNLFRGSGRTAPMAAPTERVRELADSGKGEAAAKLLVQEFRGLARQQLDFDSMQNGDYEMDELGRRLKELGLRDEFFSQLDPGDSGSTAKLAAFAVGHEFFGQKEIAVTAYRKALESNQKQDPVRVRLMILELPSDPTAFQTHFVKLQKKSQSAAGHMLGFLFYNEKMAAKDLLKLVEQVTAYLDTVDTQKTELDWLPQVLESVGGQISIDDEGEYLSSIFTKKSEPATENEKEPAKEKEAREKTEALSAVRDGVHQKLAKKMIGIPSVAADGFTALLGAAEAKELPVDDQFVEYAKTAIRPFKAKGSAAMGMGFGRFGSRHYYSSGDSEEEVTKRTPVEFLARHFGLSASGGDAEIEGLAKELVELRAESTAEELKGTYALYRSAPEAFVQAANDFLEASKKNNRRRPDLAGAGVEKVVEIWIDRDAPAEISPLLLDYSKNDKSNQNFYGQGDGGYLQLYLSKLAESGKTDDVSRFLTSYRTSLFGTDQELADVVAMAKDPRRRNTNRKEMVNYSKYIQLIASLAEAKETVFIAFDEAAKYQIQGIADSAGYQFRAMFREFESTGVEDLIKWLGDSKLLAEIDEFDPIQLAEGGGEPMLWASAVADLKGYASEEFCTKVDEYFKAKTDLTFGEKLLQMGYGGQLNSPNAVYNLYGEYVEKIESLPEQKQQMLVQFVGQLAAGNNRFGGLVSSELTAEGKLAKNLIRKQLGSSVEADVEKVFAARRISDLGIEEHEFSDWANNILGQMDQSDPNKIVKMLSKIISLTEKNRNNIYYGNDPASSLMEELFSNIEMASFGVLCSVLADEKMKGFSVSAQTERKLSGFFSSQISNEQAANKEAKFSHVQALDVVYRKLGETIGDRDTTCLIPIYQTALVGIDDADFEKLEQWSTMESEGGKYKQLAAAMKLAIQSTQAFKIIQDAGKKTDESKTPVKIARLAELTDYQSSMVDILKDDARTVSWRLTIATSLIQRDKQLPIEGVWECSKLIGEALKKKIAIDDQLIAATFAAVLDGQSDEEFKANAELFGNAWAAVSLQANNRNYGYYRSRGTNLAGSAVELFAKLENRPAISKIIRSYESDAKRRGFIATLIENGFQPDARKLCLSIWIKPDEVDLDDSSIFYTKALHEALPEFIKLFPDDSTKLLAETFFASLPDPEDAVKAVDASLENRLEKLAERYSQVEFSSKSQNQLTLVLLAESKSAARFIAEPLAEIASGLKVNDLYDEDQGVIEWNLKLMMAHVGLQIRNGNFDPAKKLYGDLTAIAPSSDSNEWAYRNLMQQVSSGVSKPISDSIVSSSPEELERLLPIVAEINRPDSKFPIDQSMNVLVHVIAGKTDQLLTQFEAAKGDGEEEDETQSRFDPDGIWAKVVEYLKSRKEFDDAEIRLRFVKDIWKFGSSVKFDVGSGHFQDGIQESCSGCRTGKFGLDAIMESKLLSAEEIAEHGATLAETASVNGEIWRQVAREQFKLEQYEKAAVSYKKALDGSTEEMKQAKTNRQIEYANALFKLDRTDEAQKLLENIDASQLLGDNIATYRDLQSRLSPE